MNKKSLKEYRAWKAMKARCSAPSAKKGIYMNIDVCDRWKNSYNNFVNDLGIAPSDKHSLDRIDNSKGYYPENCRWALQKTQCSNRGSFNKIFTYQGKTLVLKEWARQLDIKYTTLYFRIYRSNMTFEQAVDFDKSYEFQGFKGSLKQIVKKFGKVRYELVIDRLHRKWDLKKALYTPLKKS